MKTICLVKFVPDVENFIYDYERNILVRENVKMILNPDDACALAFAIKMKDKHPENFIEVVTMAPKSVRPMVEELLRLNVDKGTIISDKLFVGSDSYITSKILARYLRDETYDCILTGTHALDGDTSHVPAQLGEILKLNQMSDVIRIDEEFFTKDSAVFEVDHEASISKYAIELPAILSLQKESKYKLPYVKFKDLDLDVTHKLNIITNRELAFNEKEVGIEGSLTKVSRTYVKHFEKKGKIIVNNDDEGIKVVYSFLKDKGFI